MSTGKKLTKITDNYFENPTLYRNMVGAFQYVNISRPDIAYAVSKLSQCMESPSKLHWQACKWVLRFLKGTDQYGLQFTPGDIKDLVAYTNTNWDVILTIGSQLGDFAFSIEEIWFHRAERNIPLLLDPVQSLNTEL